MKSYVKRIFKSTLFGEFILKIQLNHFKRKWISKNRNNETVPMNVFSVDNVSVGDYSYGELNVVSFNAKTNLRIGRFVSLAQDVTFLLDAEHYTDRLSTYPFRVKMLNELRSESFSKGDIIIEDDVWIGYGVIIMSGVHIGKGAIIAAGAIVTKDIPAYSIVGGVPGEVIKYRFSKEVIEVIKDFEYHNLTYEKVVATREIFYTAVTEENVDDVFRELSK